MTKSLKIETPSPALTSIQKMRGVNLGSKERIENIIGHDSKAHAVTKVRYGQTKAYLDALHEHGEGSPVGQFVGELNASVAARKNARKERLGAEKVKTTTIEDVLQNDPTWKEKAMDIIPKGLRERLGATSNEDIKKIVETHSLAKDALVNSVTERKIAYKDFAEEFGFSRDNRFEDPIAYTHSSGETKYRMINADGHTVDLTTEQVTKYTKLVDARKSHEEARKNLSELEQQITSQLSSNKPSEAQRKALEEAQTNLSKAQTEETNSKNNVAAFYDKDGVLKTPDEYKAPVQDAPVNETEAQKTAREAKEAADKKAAELKAAKETGEGFWNWYTNPENGWGTFGRVLLTLPVIGAGAGLIATIWNALTGGNRQAQPA